MALYGHYMKWCGHYIELCGIIYMYIKFYLSLSQMPPYTYDVETMNRYPGVSLIDMYMYSNGGTGDLFRKWNHQCIYL